MTLVAVDFAILGIIGLSALVSLVRGFIREALSLVSWVLAGGVALVFTPYLAPWLADVINIAPLRTAVSFLILFIAALLLAGMVGFLVNRIIAKNGLSGTDRIVGLLFGLARGVIIISVVVLLGTYTPFAQDTWWQNSTLIGYFEDVAVWLQEFLPEEFTSKAQGRA